MKSLLLAGMALLTAPAAFAVTDPTAGPFPQASGEMVIGIPATPSCTTTIVTDAPFANSAYGPDGAWSGTYTPPADCAGPWSRVVLTMSAYVEPGTQFDRIGEVQIGGAELLHFTTPEGTNGRTLWQVQRDVTAYAPLLTASQPVWFQIGNVTDGTYTGIFHGSLALTFYKTGPGAPAGGHADIVAPLGAVDPSARSLYTLDTSASRLTRQVNFPQNLVRLEAEVYASGHGGCEEDWWYQPFACLGEPYRELAVYVDNKLAGLAPVFPALFTGGWGPDWWRPIPGPRTLNLRPYTLDLTPFVGTLTDGLAHSVSVGLLGWTDNPGNGDYWPVAANLLEYVNPDSRGRSVGGLLSYDAPANLTQSVTGDPVNATTVYTTSSHHLKISGWLQAPVIHKVTTTVEEQLDDTAALAAAVTKNDWHWVATSSSARGTGVEALASDSTYQLVRDGARFAFIDAARGSVTRNGTVVSWTQLDDRMQTSGPALLTGIVGASQESWKFSASDGTCVDHELVGAVQNILRDDVSTNCPPALPLQP